MKAVRILNHLHIDDLFLKTYNILQRFPLVRLDPILGRGIPHSPSCTPDSKTTKPKRATKFPKALHLDSEKVTRESNAAASQQLVRDQLDPIYFGLPSQSDQQGHTNVHMQALRITPRSWLTMTA